MKLKRGAKIFLSCAGGAFAGPFKWTLVREWVALRFVAHDSLIRTDDGESMLVSAIEALITLPESMQRAESPIIYYQSEGRTRFPSAPRQHTYARSLGCPFETSHLDKHLTWRVISQLEEAFPEKASEAERQACEEEIDRRFREEPATQRQRTYLTSIGVNAPGRLSKIEASRLIVGPPSEGQMRRLRFYQIPLPPQFSKEEASDLIDSYVRQHPESELTYQAWKQSGNSEVEFTPPVAPSGPQAEKKPWWKLW